MFKTKFFSFAILFSLCASGLFGQSKLYNNAFPLQDVKINAAPFKHACDLNIEVLLQYDVDKLLAPFLREAGLTPKKSPYGNWESDGLDGHIGGHYLTAMALHYAATGNQTCKQRMEYMIAELKRCQDASINGKGYIGGVPVNGTLDGRNINLWTELRKGNVAAIWRFWVPWYNLHKTYAGLRDAWLYANNEQAKKMFLELCDWGVELISHLDDRQMESMLGNEFGGMNEVYADAYQIEPKPEYLVAAKRFSHKHLFDSMAKRVDNLDNMHANTQVPKAVGYQRVAELTNDKAYVDASQYFWETVVHNRTLAFGGNSRSEYFPELNKHSDYIHERQGPESCNTYNMMKLTEGLFRMDPKAEYVDFYERAMFNHILSTQHPTHGGYVYFTPAVPGHYRVYSAPEKAMWCCVGSGMENHAKYGQFVYTHSTDHKALYVNLFVGSELNWKQKNAKIKQITDFPYEESSKIVVDVKRSTRFAMKIRRPWWAKEFKAMCKGVDYAANSKPGEYIVIDRKWKKGDVVQIDMPMEMTIEEMPNVPYMVSVMRGPILMAAKTNDERMYGLVAGDGRWEHIAHGPLMPLLEMPALIGERSDLLKKLNNMKAVPGKKMTFAADNLFENTAHKNLVFEPFFNIHDSRYMMYWLSMNNADYTKFKTEKENEEKQRIELDRRTIDRVEAGRQQPEADHAMQTQQSHRGSHMGESWRDARNGGFFEYRMATNNDTNLSLMVRYWGNEGPNRKFDILVDGKVLASENISDKWQRDAFVNVEYKIPAEMLTSKSHVVVRFQSATGTTAGGIFEVRMLNNK